MTSPGPPDPKIDWHDAGGSQAAIAALASAVSAALQEDIRRHSAALLAEASTELSLIQRQMAAIDERSSATGDPDSRRRVGEILAEFERSFAAHEKSFAAHSSQIDEVLGDLRQGLDLRSWDADPSAATSATRTAQATRKEADPPIPRTFASQGPHPNGAASKSPAPRVQGCTPETVQLAGEGPPTEDVAESHASLKTNAARQPPEWLASAVVAAVTLLVVFCVLAVIGTL